MPSHPTVVAVLPAYNLERSIAAIVERTRPFVDHVVVTADASRDGTAAAARAAGADVPEPESVRGKGFALQKGLARARELGAHVVVMMDSDGQHLPEEIPAVVQPILEGRADVVSGSRMLGTLKTRLVNRFGNHVLRSLSFLLTGRWLSDTETGFRAFTAEAIFSMPLTARGYEIESEIMMRALHARRRIVEVPIHVPFALKGATAWDGVKVAWYKVKLAVGLKLGRIRS